MAALSRRRIRRAAVVPAIVLAGVLAPEILAGEAVVDGNDAEVSEAILERLREQTVMLSVTRRDQSVEQGAGAVLCQQDRHAYVLTAHRLFAGERPGGRSVLRRPARTEIRFFRDRLPALVDDRAAGERVVTLRQVPEQGVVLLTFPIARDLEATAQELTLRTLGDVALSGIAIGWRTLQDVSLSWIADRKRSDPAEGSGRGTPVLALGAGGAAGSWTVERGVLGRGGGGLLYRPGGNAEGIPRRETFASGPLYTKSGALLGIKLRPLSAEELGTEPGLYSAARSMADILPAMAKWLPIDCRRRLEMKADPARVVRQGGRLVSPRPDEPTLDPERLKEQTVMITVISREGDSEQGAGVVLCQEDGRTYVLTAHHVLAGKRRPGEAPPGGEKAPPGAGERGFRGIDVHFFHHGHTGAFTAAGSGAGETAMTVHPVPAEDLALLVFPWDRELELTAFLGPPAIRPGAWEDAETDVIAVGFPRATTWGTARGRVLAGGEAGEDGFVYHSAPVVTGFSGGPLFAATGALVGINVERIAGEKIGKALPVARILPAIDRWLPAGCLRAREARVPGVVQAVQAEAFSGVPPVLLAEAEELRVEWVDDPLTAILVIGGHEVKRRRSRAGILDSILGSMQRTYRFTLVEKSGIVWQSQCTRSLSLKEPGARLACTVRPEEGEEAMTFEMRWHLDSRREGAGVVKAGGLRIEIAESKPVTVRTLRQAVRTGYHFYVGDRIVGAVDTVGDETVWLHPSVTKEARSAFLMAVAALLLPSATDNS